MDDIPEGYEAVEFVKKIQKKGQDHSISLITLCILMICVEQIVLVGITSLDGSVSTASSTLTNMGNIFTRLSDDGNAMQNYGNSFTSDYNQVSVTCRSYTQSLSGAISSYKNSVSTYTSSIKSVNGFTSNLDSYLTTYGLMYQHIFLGIVYGLGVFMAFLFIICQCCRARCCTKCSVFLGEVVYLLIIILAVVVLVVAALLADFCVSPVASLNRILPAGSVQNITAYYTSCQGSNQLAKYTNDAKTSAITLNTTLMQLATTPNSPCTGDPYIRSMQRTSVKVFGSLSDVQGSLSCATINPLWTAMVDNAVCTDLLGGLSYVWISQIVTSLLLFIILIVASVTYNFFDRFDMVVPDLEAIATSPKLGQVESQPAHRSVSDSAQPSAPSATQVQLQKKDKQDAMTNNPWSGAGIEDVVDDRDRGHNQNHMSPSNDGQKQREDDGEDLV